MFGTANQLLGMLALCIGTTLIIKMGKAKYIWVTLVPMLFMASTTFTASVKLIQDFILKSSTSPDPVTFRINALLMGVMLVLAVVVVVDSVIKWYGYLVKKRPIETTEVTVYSSQRTN
jgi:carbon starvation protein